MDAGELSADATACAFATGGTDAARRRRPRVSEAALVRAAQAGSEQAIGELFDRHWDAAHRVAYLITHDRAAAEDIAQEAFLAALRALASFDRRRPLRPWLQRIVVNRAIDFARARKLRNEVDADALGELAGPEAPGSPRLDGFAGALATLPLEQRAVIVLRYLMELTPREIAELLDLPRGTVNSRLRRGLDALGVLVGEEQRP